MYVFTQIKIITLTKVQKHFYEESWLARIISLHIRSMWETICDAWACWSGWNFGPNSTVYPYSVEYPLPLPPNENCQRVQVRVQNTPPKWKLSESTSPSTEYPQKMKIVRVQVWVQNTPPPWKLSESPNPRVSEYPPSPKNENCQRVQVVSTEYPPKMKIVRESKSESFRIPPQWKLQRVQIREFQNTPPKIGKTSDFKLQNSLKIREIYVETNL